MDQQLNSMERTLDEIQEALKRRGNPASNVNTLRVEGAGSIWHGVAIGAAVSGVIAGMVWIGWVASDARVSVRQAEAYRAAVYVVAPKFAEKIDEELERNKERQKE
ncbi:hypothetical protein [Xanthomonas sp. LMG 12461]|uniref:hypothetical protein n=1 Tax=Xanthomonas sp. LMG 12461 TaxID=2014543 RepID=UPI00186B147F|nr:hypothetical protein [Xanthomonas sp. LMG 12461]